MAGLTTNRNSALPVAPVFSQCQAQINFIGSCLAYTYEHQQFIERLKNSLTDNMKKQSNFSKLVLAGIVSLSLSGFAPVAYAQGSGGGAGGSGGAGGASAGGMDGTGANGMSGGGGTGTMGGARAPREHRPRIVAAQIIRGRQRPTHLRQAPVLRRAPAIIPVIPIRLTQG